MCKVIIKYRNSDKLQTVQIPKFEYLSNVNRVTDPQNVFRVFNTMNGFVEVNMNDVSYLRFVNQ